MIRTFGLVTPGATAVPWFGDVTTAAVAVPNSQAIQVPVANTAIYQAQDRIILNPSAAAPTNTRTILRINKIVSATVLQCQSESDAPVSAYPTGTIIALAINCWCIDFQGAGAGAVTLGTDSTVTATPGGSAFRVVQATVGDIANVYSICKSTGQNSINTDEGWMIGTGSILIAAHVN